MRQLEEALQDIPSVLPWSLLTSLTPGERRLLARLVRGAGRVVRREALGIAIAGSLRIDAYASTANIVSVLVHRLRRKVRHLGVTVEAVPYEGYRLTPESVEIIERMRRDEQQRKAA